MNYTTEYNQGFYHALNLDNPSVQDCPYGDEERATRWIEGYLEGEKAPDKVSVRGMD